MNLLTVMREYYLKCLFTFTARTRPPDERDPMFTIKISDFVSFDTYRKFKKNLLKKYRIFIYYYLYVILIVGINNFIKIIQLILIVNIT